MEITIEDGKLIAIEFDITSEDKGMSIQAHYKITEIGTTKVELPKEFTDPFGS